MKEGKRSMEIEQRWPVREPGQAVADCLGAI
jgi:hypothetical protein